MHIESKTFWFRSFKTMEKVNLKREDARPHFYKIIFGEDIKQHMRIPPAFMKHLSRDMSNRATLTDPSSSRWRVTVSMDGNGTYLEKGWKKFMEGNNLGDNEFLMFRYDGNMQFNVKIFDKNGVRRQPAPVSADSGATRGRGRPRKTPLGSQSSRTVKTVKPFNSKSPHFKISMMKHNVEKTFLLRIPRTFSTEAHLPPSKGKIVLRDSAGRAWDVMCLHDTGGHYLSGGWGSFARHANLKLGDVCVFELTNEKELQLHVV